MLSPERDHDKMLETEMLSPGLGNTNGGTSVKYLRDSYNAAKNRAAELASHPPSSLSLKAYSQNAARLYSAVATLLYATISIAKADDLEKFVRKRAAQVPNTLFDIEEWGPVLNLAHSVRIGDSGHRIEELVTHKNDMQFRVVETAKEFRQVKKSFQQTASRVSTQFNRLEQEFKLYQEEIITKLRLKAEAILTAYKAQRVENDSLKIALKEREINEERILKGSISIEKHQAELDMQTMMHKQEIDDLTKAHHDAITKCEDTCKQTVDNIKKEMEWQEKNLAGTISNNDKLQAQKHEHLSAEIARLEKQLKELTEENKRSLQEAAERSQSLLSSTEAAWAAKLQTTVESNTHVKDSLTREVERLEKLLENALVRGQDTIRTENDRMQEKLQYELQKEHEKLERLRSDHEVSLKQVEELWKTKLAQNTEMHDLRVDHLKRQVDDITQELQRVKEENTKNSLRVSEQLAQIQSDALLIASLRETSASQHSAMERLQTEHAAAVKTHQTDIEHYKSLLSQEKNSQDKNLATKHDEEAKAYRHTIAELESALSKAKEESKEAMETVARLQHELDALKASALKDVEELTVMHDLHIKQICEDNAKSADRVRQEHAEELEVISIKHHDALEKAALELKSAKNTIAKLASQIDKLQKDLNEMQSQQELQKSKWLAMHKVELLAQHMADVAILDATKDKSSAMNGHASSVGAATLYRRAASDVISSVFDTALKKKQQPASPAAISDSALQKELDAAKEKIIKLTNELSAKSGRATFMQLDINSANAELTHVKKELQALKLAQTSLQKNFRSVVTENEDLHEKVRSLQASADQDKDLKEEVAKLKNELNAKNGRATFMSMDLTAATKELGLLKKKEKEDRNKISAQLAEINMSTRLSQGIMTKLQHCRKQLLLLSASLESMVALSYEPERQCSINLVRDVVNEALENVTSRLPASFSRASMLSSLRVNEQILADIVQYIEKSVESVDTLADIMNEESGDNKSTPREESDAIRVLEQRNTDLLHSLRRLESSQSEAPVTDMDQAREVIAELRVQVDELKRQESASAALLKASQGLVASLTDQLHAEQAKVNELGNKCSILESQLQNSSGDSAATLKLQEDLQRLQKTLYDQQSKLAEHNGLLNKHATLKEEFAEYKRQQANVSRELQEALQREERLTYRVKSLEDDLRSKASEKEKEYLMSPRSQSKVYRVQAIARGFLARVRANKARIHIAAKQSGVLVAAGKTIQGETGWYCAPDGSMYYFVLNDGQWILTCGPVSREDYDKAVAPLRVKDGLDKSTLLRKCNFEIIPDASEYEGDIYISPVTLKLFLAVSVSDIMAPG